MSQCYLFERGTAPSKSDPLFFSLPRFEYNKAKKSCNWNPIVTASVRKSPVSHPPEIKLNPDSLALVLFYRVIKSSQFWDAY